MFRVAGLFLFILTSTSLAGSTECSAYKLLDTLAIQAGTDKSSIDNHYTKVYAKLFKDIRNDSFKFLEIGIFKGYSAKMWEDFFPNADMHFIDITDSNIKYWSKRSRYDFLDQGDAAQLHQYMDKVGGDFDVIIDDGGHFMNQQIVSFNVLFPYLKSGGMYIIEDLCTSYWKYYGGEGTFEQPQSGPGSTTELLKQLTDDLNYYTARTCCADFDKIPANVLSSLNAFQKNIESIHFYPNMCVIIKR